MSKPSQRSPESHWVLWRFLSLEARMESWQQSEEQVGRRRIGSRRWRRRRLCGWCGRCAPSWALISARSGESLTSWGSVWSRCASGSVRLISTTSPRPAPRRWIVSGSENWSRRIGSCIARTRFCARRRFSSRRSSTAHRDDGLVHRREPRRVRGRADLRAVADRPVGLLRRQESTAVGARPAGCGAGSPARGVVDGELSSLRGAQVVEGRPARGDRRGPRPGRPSHAPRRHRRHSPAPAGAHHLGDTPPTEFEEAYAARQADHALVGNQ